MITLNATPASPGIAIGPTRIIETTEVVIPVTDAPLAAFENACASAAEELRRLRSAAIARGRSDAGEVLEAQALMAEDPMLADSISEALAGGSTLAEAIQEATAQIRAIFAGIDDLYIAARADDVGEVTARISRHLAGVDSPDLAHFEEPCVLLAAGLTAAETSQLDPEMVLGFVIEEGGPTGHVAIIARSLGLPAVVGAAGLLSRSQGASTIAIDGSTGTVLLDPDTENQATLRERAAAEAAAIEAAEAFHGASVDYDGRPIFVSANVASSADIGRAVAASSDGIGLFRTEFLFLDCDRPPTEEEQYEHYAAAARAFSDPVVIRTFDIGGDKPARYLKMGEEENPFLGMRGVRLYHQLHDLFEAQVRAALRAAAEGDVWLMIPMVASVDEVLEVRAVIDKIVADLVSAPTPTGTVKLGVMVEVPSAALLAPAIAPYVDFFSIGTNDLTQYTLAADRTSNALDHYQDPVHPAVLRLCSMTVAGAALAGIPVSVCGLAAADPVAAALYAAMGVTKLSVTPRSVNATKAGLAQLDPAIMSQVLVDSLKAPSAAAVRIIVGAALDAD